MELIRQSVVSQCGGCNNYEGTDGSTPEVCSIWVSPATKWRLGNCPSATHVKTEFKSTELKVRVGQQKQKKHGGR